MPIDDLYWNSIDFGSEEDEDVEDEDHEILPPLTSTKSYIDPWDLENYAYIKEHLDSMDLNSDPNSIELTTPETNSASFYYVPGDQQIKEQANYVAIDEIREYHRNHNGNNNYNNGSAGYYDRAIFFKDLDENPYREDFIVNNSYNWRRPIDYHNHNTSRDRSLSFSYGDDYGSYQHDQKQEIYSKLEDFDKDATLPLYDDLRKNRRKPRNFGLSNYGHLKIDYSYSWNNLNKYICS